jgi:hypothetical protein
MAAHSLGALLHRDRRARLAPAPVNHPDRGRGGTLLHLRRGQKAMAPSSSLLARLRSVLGRRRSRPTPPADFHFDLRDALRRADIAAAERRCANRVFHDAEDDGLPRADARRDEPRNVEPDLDPYMATLDRH